MTEKMAAVCLGWRHFRRWIPASAFAGMTGWGATGGGVMRVLVVVRVE